MIRVRDGRRVAGVVLCDRCGREIRDADAASALWRHAIRAGGSADGQLTDVYFAHGECVEAFTEDRPLPAGQSWQADGLCLWLASLGRHLGIDPAEAAHELAAVTGMRH